MIRIASALLLVFLSVSCCWAQWWIEPSVNFGTTQLEWGPVTLKNSQPTVEVKGGYRGLQPVWFSGSFTSRRGLAESTYIEHLAFPLTVNGQAFGGKKSGQAGGAQKDEIVEIEFRSQTFAFRGTGPYRYGIASVVRTEVLSLNISACGKVAGKQVQASETLSRWYPQIGLAYAYREGPAFVRLIATAGSDSSHIEGSLNWNVSRDMYLGIGGQRSYFGFTQGRVEQATFTVQGGVRF